MLACTFYILNFISCLISFIFFLLTLYFLILDFPIYRAATFFYFKYYPYKITEKHAWSVFIWGYLFACVMCIAPPTFWYYKYIQFFAFCYSIYRFIDLGYGDLTLKGVYFSEPWSYTFVNVNLLKNNKNFNIILIDSSPFEVNTVIFFYIFFILIFFSL